MFIVSLFFVGYLINLVFDSIVIRINKKAKREINGTTAIYLSILLFFISLFLLLPLGLVIAPSFISSFDNATVDNGHVAKIAILASLFAAGIYHGYEKKRIKSRKYKKL